MRKLIFILLLSIGGKLYAQYTVGQQTGKDANGNYVPLSLSGTVALTNTLLPANASWTSGWLKRGQYIGAQINLYSNVAGSYRIEYSDDSVNYTASMPIINVAYFPTQATRKGAFDIGASYVRFSYFNSSTAQTAFKFEIRFLTTQAQASMETLNAMGADTRFAQWTKSRIETKDSDTGTYRPVYATGNSLNVNVTNPVNSVSVNNLPSVQPISGTVNANVTFPNTQQVNGSVSVSNFPATQPVSGSIAVNNFPSTQPISGSITVSNPYTVTASDSTKFRKVQSIDNFPSGFNVNNFPSNQNVTTLNPYTVLGADSIKYRKTVSVDNFPTTIGVNNFPATQNVSVTGFDSTKTRIQYNLANGASTSALQTAGNTSLNNIDGDLGASTDAAATTGNGSVISLLKGLNTAFANGLTTSATPYTTYNFDYLSTSGVQTLKSTGGTFGTAHILNPTSSDLFLQIFNTAGTVTLGTTAPNYVIPIDATIGVNVNNGTGLSFPLGIKYAITTTPRGATVTGTTINVSLGYK